MLEKFKQTIKDKKLIKSGDKIVAGVSGGPDSVCLLYILDEIKYELDFELVVAHVNYGTREKDSDHDEECVRSLARKLGLNCKILKATRHKTQVTNNLEETYRNVRYDFFNKILKEESADSIAVAHNKNDQAETMLMFFLRGSGLRGLSGIKYKQGKIIRPILDISKNEIYNFLKKNKIAYREDISNKDLKFTRNKIRHQLVPLLEKEYNPNLLSTLMQNSEIITDDYEFINETAQALFKVLAEEKNGGIRINLDKFFNLYRSLQREIVRTSFQRFNISLKNVSVLDIEETLRVLKEGRAGAKREIKGLRFQKKGGNIVISLIK